MFKFHGGRGGVWDKIKTTEEKNVPARIKTSLQKAKNTARIRITICITTWGFPALNTIRVEATTQRLNLSTPPVKSSPDIREHWKDLKGIGSVFLSPHWCNNAQATVWTWSVLSVGNHVCPTNWMSCIQGGNLRTLFSTTFKCSVSQNYPHVRKVRTKPLMIGVSSRLRKLLRRDQGENLSHQPNHHNHCLYVNLLAVLCVTSAKGFTEPALQAKSKITCLLASTNLKYDCAVHCK